MNLAPGDSDDYVEIGLNGNLQPLLACLGPPKTKRKPTILPDTLLA